MKVFFKSQKVRNIIQYIFPKNTDIKLIGKSLEKGFTSVLVLSNLASSLFVAVSSLSMGASHAFDVSFPCLRDKNFEA